MRSMQLLTSVVLTVLLGGALCVVFTRPVQNGPANETDLISGEWEGAFHVSGTTTAFMLELKLDGNKVSGKVASNHTGPGVVSKGSWIDSKLLLTLEFKSHESIEMTGTLKEGKLVGEFRTEGFVANWGAVRKGQKEVAKRAEPAASENSVDPISGAWDASLLADGTTVPLQLDLKLERNRVTGTTDSPHLGSGAIDNGSWSDKKLQSEFSSHGVSIKFTGSLKDGRLVGEFNASNGMKGQWEAKRK